MKAAAVALVAILLAVAATTQAGEWQTLRGCLLIDNPANDGDSFHVMAGGTERIYRLYFVDCPEAESGGYVTERVQEQAAEFGITEAASVEIGRKAAAFTKAVLSRPFTVVTRGQNARGASKIQREYAFVTTADGEDLGEMLVERGLARSHGQAAASPTAKRTAAELRGRYDTLEAKAKKQKAGAWGPEADKPTQLLPRYEE